MIAGTTPSAIHTRVDPSPGAAAHETWAAAPASHVLPEQDASPATPTARMPLSAETHVCTSSVSTYFPSQKMAPVVLLHWVVQVCDRSLRQVS